MQCDIEFLQKYSSNPNKVSSFFNVLQGLVFNYATFPKRDGFKIHKYSIKKIACYYFESKPYSRGD